MEISICIDGKSTVRLASLQNFIPIGRLDHEISPFLFRAFLAVRSGDLLCQRSSFIKPPDRATSLQSQPPDFLHVTWKSKWEKDKTRRWVTLLLCANKRAPRRSLILASWSTRAAPSLAQVSKEKLNIILIGKHSEESAAITFAVDSSSSANKRAPRRSLVRLKEKTTKWS